jgi:hypothetical protein
MPKYYHIHRGTEPSTLEKKFIKNIPLFFSKKNSNWYNIEKDISKEYGGYRIYEIYIPSSRYTLSFNPTSVDKIVKITSYNINDYILLLNEHKNNRNNFIEEMKKRNIIGIDATIEHTYDKIKYKDAYFTGPPEGYIWRKPSDIKIKLLSIIKL